MYIGKVTITGADDQVDRNALYELSDRFPFVEWGILYNRGKEGKPRYPSYEWIDKFDRYAPGFVRKAAHLCGWSANEFCNGDLSAARNAAFHSPTYDRLQVNIHEDIRRGATSFAEVADLLIRSNKVVPTIVQLNEITRPFILALSKKTDGNYVQILVDESRGSGHEMAVSSDLISVELYNLMKTTTVGFAGGINPGNVLSIAKTISCISNRHYCVRSVLSGDVQSPPETWIDMESGVRTDNEFDLKKVENVLQKMERAMRGDYES